MKKGSMLHEKNRHMSYFKLQINPKQHLILQTCTFKTFIHCIALSIKKINKKMSRRIKMIINIVDLFIRREDLSLDGFIDSLSYTVRKIEAKIEIFIVLQKEII